jgi:hypothetical protein
MKLSQRFNHGYRYAIPVALALLAVQGCSKNNDVVTPSCNDSSVGTTAATTDNQTDFANGEKTASALGYTDGQTAGEQAAYQNGYDSANGYKGGYNSAQGYNKGYSTGKGDPTSSSNGTQAGTTAGNKDGNNAAGSSGTADGQNTGAKNGNIAGIYDGDHSDADTQGYNDGYATGQANGQSTGYNDGYADGYPVGQTDASNTSCGTHGSITPKHLDRRIASGATFTAANTLPANASSCAQSAYSSTRNSQKFYNDGYQKGLGENADYSKGYADFKANTTSYNNGAAAGFKDGVTQGNKDGIAQAKLDTYNSAYQVAYNNAFDSYHDQAYNNAYSAAYTSAYNSAYNSAYSTAYNSIYYTYESNGETDGYNYTYTNAYNSGFSDGYYAGYYDVCPSSNKVGAAPNASNAIKVTASSNPYFYRNVDKTPPNAGTYQAKLVERASFYPTHLYKGDASAMSHPFTIGSKRPSTLDVASRLTTKRVSVRSAYYNSNVMKFVHDLKSQTAMSLPYGKTVELRVNPTVQ